MSSAAAGPSRKVNLRSTAVKRIMQEAAEMADPDEDDFVAAPLEEDIFEWHCTMRGVKGSEYDGGLYHLRILLPPSYPMSAPDIMILTPNGRFELGKKICIDGLTSFHAGSWQPAWGVRTAITGLRSFWMQGGEALSAIGALDYPKEERKRLAKLSREWTCPKCGVKNLALLPDRSLSETSHAAVEDTPAQPVVTQEAAPSAPASVPSPDVPPPVLPIAEPSSVPVPVPNPPPSSNERPPPPLPAEAAGRTADLTPRGDPPSTPPLIASRPRLESQDPSIRPVTPVPPRPPPTLTTTNTTTTTTTTTVSRPVRATPLWLDGLIVAFSTLFVLLVLRRMSS